MDASGKTTFVPTAAMNKGGKNELLRRIVLTV